MDYEERLLRLAAYPERGIEVVVTNTIASAASPATITRVGPLEDGVPLFVEATYENGNRSSWPGTLWADAVLKTRNVMLRELPPMPTFTEQELNFLDTHLSNQEEASGLVRMTSVGDDARVIVLCLGCNREIRSTKEHHEWSTEAGHADECPTVVRHSLFVKVRHWRKRRLGQQVLRHVAAG